jgi:hypothetical protein
MHRAINERKITDSVPLAMIDDWIDNTGEARLITQIDVRFAYN